jgi:Bacterial archaeo-eukaryotic release factor family 3
VICRTDLERLAPLWRKATTYPCLVDETLAGNPEALGPHQLHTRAWAIVEPLFLQALREAAARYDQLAGTGLTSQDPGRSSGPPRTGASTPCSSPNIRPARAPMGVASRSVTRAAGCKTCSSGRQRPRSSRAAPSTCCPQVRSRGAGVPRRCSVTEAPGLRAVGLVGVWKVVR